MDKKTSSQLAAGAFSGFVSCILLQPLDVLKTRVQEKSYRDVGPFNRSLFVLTQAVSKEGILTLWRGTLPTIIRNVPGTASYFFVLSKMKEFFMKHGITNASQNGLSNFGNLACGASSRALVGFLLMPFSVMKVRLESQSFRHHTLINGIRAVISANGYKGLFAGFWATALRDAPFAGLYILFYEKLKVVLTNDQDKKHRSIVNMTAGITAGFLATLITQPFDMIKTRIQLQPSIYTSLISSTQKIIQSESIFSLFRGVGPRLLRKSLSSAITWTIYEEIIERTEGKSAKQ